MNSTKVFIQMTHSVSMLSSSKCVEDKKNSEFCFLLLHKKKWQAYLRTCTKAANHHKSFHLVQFCLNMPPQNAVNQVLLLWKQTTERHRLSAESTKHILTLQFNSQNVSHNQFHTYTSDIPEEN